MPYTAISKRKELDPLIDQLATKIVQQGKASGDEKAFAGMINYTCTRLTAQVLRLQFGAIRYWMVALIVGVFHNIADEFYRRIGVPYEDEQIKKNGDVDEYIKLINAMKE
ncbi:hypothetical protein HY621_03180 [Candidatus Uhrbacteria bacterium]|nr:hypothetical protein [Candidatus Uhrbacteria bacterium]